jgi:hypothetical protein
MLIGIEDRNGTGRIYFRIILRQSNVKNADVFVLNNLTKKGTLLGAG